MVVKKIENTDVAVGKCDHVLAVPEFVIVTSVAGSLFAAYTVTDTIVAAGQLIVAVVAGAPAPPPELEPDL